MARREAERTPHPALRATFSPTGRREGVHGAFAGMSGWVAAATPHPALRATFSHKGGREVGLISDFGGRRKTEVGHGAA